MQNLWKKESHRGDAILVDLLAEYRKSGAVAEWDIEFQASNREHRIRSKIVKPIKDNEVSDEFRNEGNVYFRERKWEDAMNSYNNALRFAEIGTKNVSFAYANRSACFLKLQQYYECMLDIVLAVKANYPKRLMSKLEERQFECQKKLGISGKYMYIQARQIPEPKLDYNSNEKFPCMADVLEIKRTEEFGRHIVALKDIDAGKMILVEKHFVSSIHTDETSCYECLRKGTNFLACPKCTDVHQKYCGTTIHRMAKGAHIIAKSILIALTAIPNIDELMSFVDDVLSKRAMEVPQATKDPRSKYATFLSLQPSKRLKHDIQTIHKVYKGLLDIPNVKSMFTSEKSQRFLMHLIVEHAVIIANNSFGGRIDDSLGCVSSFFNHNCAPNVYHSSVAHYEVFITVAPIKKGQQLFISYLNSDDNLPTRIRQIKLLIGWNFVCKCDKCMSINPAYGQASEKQRIFDRKFEEITNEVIRRGSEEFNEELASAS